MKKNVLLKILVSLVLAVAMMVSVVACTTNESKDEPEPTANNPTSAPTNEPTPEPSPTPAETPVPMDDILAALSSLQYGEVKNVILFIGDGMGQNHVPATDLITGGRYNGKLALEFLPSKGIAKTVCTEGEPDSASGGTALSTGYKGKRSQIALNAAGQEVQSVVELAHSLGKSTGAITTESIVDATPATFTVHAANRKDESNIAKLQIETSVCDLIMGGGKAMYDKLFAQDGANYIEYFKEHNITYTNSWDDVLAWNGEGRLIAPMVEDYWFYDVEYWSKVADRETLLGTDTEKDPTMAPCSLAEMTEQAIKILSKNEKGFFLMVEGGALDEVAHNTDLLEMTRHMLAFDEAVEVGIRYAYANKDTIIIVTADHNTGGLLPKEDADKYISKHSKDNYIVNDEWCWENTGIHCVLEGEKIAAAKNPGVVWDELPYRFTTIAHTSDDVDVWAIGPGTDELMNTNKLASFHIGKFIGKALSGEEFGATAANGTK